MSSHTTVAVREPSSEHTYNIKSRDAELLIKELLNFFC